MKPVVIFILTKGTKVLMEKRPLEGFIGDQYLIPGGAVKNEELENFEAALRREMMEELGISPLEFELLIKDGIPGLNKLTLYPFFIKEWAGDIPDIGLDADDPYPLEWIEIEQALDFPVKPTKKIIEALRQYLNI